MDTCQCKIILSHDNVFQKNILFLDHIICISIDNSYLQKIVSGAFKKNCLLQRKKPSRCSCLPRAGSDK